MSIRVEGRIKITLLSDLCVSSGYSFAGIVDSDICYDDCGLPYIPAKRLKGCIRETLEQCLYAKYPDSADRLCGEAGADKPGAFTIANAFPEKYQTLRAIILGAKGVVSRRKYYHTQRILGRFTHVLGQTKLEGGVAKDNSLRYTRVVNRTSPLDGNNMVFYADAICEEELLPVLKDAVRGTRHIGLKRNRGFGVVRCEWVESGVEKPAEKSGQNKQKMLFVVSKNGKTTIYWRLTNVAPLMLSKTIEDTSENHISGSAIRGALAARYLESEGNAGADSEEFATLFLDGSSVYSNMYPCEGDAICYPAPEYINRLKKSHKLVNTIRADALVAARDETDDFAPGGGNQPKKLKGKFVSFVRNDVIVKETEKDVVYHHSRRKKNADGEEGILYGMEVLRAGQTFAGRIIVPDTCADKVKELLLSEDFYFGKSRSSQYGRCVLVQGIEQKEDAKLFHAGEHLAVTFLSDTVLLNENGVCTANAEEAAEAVKRELGILGEQDEEYLTMLQSTTVTGYSVVWNMRKSAMCAIAAGSCVVFRLNAEFETERNFIGERNGEGYGQIRLDRAEDMTYRIEERKQEADVCPEVDDLPQELKVLMTDILLNDWLDDRKYEGLTNKRMRVSNTALGRITLMLRESLDENRGDPQKALESFVKRADSIKSESTKSEAKRLISQIAKMEGSVPQWVFGSLDTENAEINEMRRIGLTDGEIEQKLRSLWGEYLMTILVENKYLGGEGNE